MEGVWYATLPHEGTHVVTSPERWMCVVLTPKQESVGGQWWKGSSVVQD